MGSRGVYRYSRIQRRLVPVQRATEELCTGAVGSKCGMVPVQRASEELSTGAVGSKCVPVQLALQETGTGTSDPIPQEACTGARVVRSLVTAHTIPGIYLLRLTMPCSFIVPKAHSMQSLVLL